MSNEFFSNYYDTPHAITPFRLALKRLVTFSPRKKLSLSLRKKDYQSLLNKKDSILFGLHQKLNEILDEQSKKYDFYDYGEGYFYQSFDEVGISGFRDTKLRIERYNLRTLLMNHTVLDIGCNAGFLLLSLHNEIKFGLGFDVNPYLIQIAEQVKKFKKIKNVDFARSAFEELNVKTKYTAILSLANHSTYDQQTKQNLDSYFNKCSNALASNGLLIFESHPPELDSPEKLELILEVLRKHFTIDSQKLFKEGGFLDRNRTLIIAKKKL